jgi:chromosome segregation ATPase
MLQDLEQLAARIGQLVQRNRQLHAERDTLQLRLQECEAEQRALRQRCADHQAELQLLRARAQWQKEGSGVEGVEQLQQVESRLRHELAQELAQRQALEAKLSACTAEWQLRLTSQDRDLQRLRAAAVAARERIEVALARLPGATAADQAAGEPH